MSKAVLISIRPKWCERIASGEKTIEIRKNRPRLEPPFKCYIYCTLKGSPELFRDDLGGDVAKWDRGKWRDRKGKIIGEFTCTKIDWVVSVGCMGSAEPPKPGICDPYTMKTSPIDDLCNAACLFTEDPAYYIASIDGYGWHISDLRIYDTPRELSEFTGLRDTRFGAVPYVIKRPPQSWCYVEEVDDA